ncbi:endonuclease/exonuclease/phosphatase family protein [Kozakia baliensis]|uniref:endonuclease/exonuclease/phosphatase family protein n=1 Tax=Kozakia baliensis TaxID=153496 RepID=UPI000691E606|nr:endonuclease/exonuclease/phosphatase family protein [Kozakia baliensis]
MRLWRNSTLKLKKYCALAALGFAGSASAHHLKITTWNLDWLTERPAHDAALPDDVARRDPNDFDRLARYARQLDSDVIGIEEVDGAQVAQRVFPADRYRLIVSHEPIVQRVGLVVRRDIQVEINPELTDLNVYDSSASHPLRAGLDVTLTDGQTRFRVLVVHLKTGCWDQPLNERGHSCPILKRQFAVLDNWVLERQDEGVPFIVLGDFNRRLTENDPLMHLLNADAPMLLTTAGRASPCWGGEYFIDHILLGGMAKSWLVPDSLRVMNYRGAHEADRARLSDHCPVSVRLDLP